MIDEYDNFASEVMMSSQPASQHRYERLLYGEGALKTLFKAIKAASEGQGLDKAFITGVSPVVVSDLTSGYNIVENISLKPELYDVCGMTESEILEPLQQIAHERSMADEQIAEALDMMRTFYNGYAFGYRQEHLIYNSTLVLYFSKHLQAYGEYPRDILDANLATDRGKLTYVAGLPGGKLAYV